MLPTILGWVNTADNDNTVSYSSRTPQTSLQDQHQPVETSHVTTAEDVQLDKMHPIISDAAMSVAPPPAVNIISPTEDQPVTIATATTAESTQTSNNEPHSSDAAMVTAEETPVTDELINTDTSNGIVIIYNMMSLLMT